jgi:hypothetical protein
MRKSLLIAVASILLIVPAGSAATKGAYVDAKGDSGSAPDITDVSIASSGTTIVFNLGISNLLRGADLTTLLLLDTDRNAASGNTDALGAEYLFAFYELDNTYWFGRWNGTDWEDTPYSTVRVSNVSSGLMITVDSSELGGTTGFNFWLRAIDGQYADGHYDDAPDAGTWNYVLAADGPEIQAVLVGTTPAAGPRTGRTFTVTPFGLRLPPNSEPISILPRPDRYTCRAVLRGSTLTGTGTGGCTWRIPKKARGKSVSVTVTVNYQGATKAVRFVYRVAA